MILYHGSNIEIAKVDLDRCMPFKDFGRGFYTTSIEAQAWRQAKRRAALDGGKPVLTLYEVADDILETDGLSCRCFPGHPTVEWAMFVLNNRNRAFTDIQSPECNTDGKYDIVAGPVADDTIGLLVRQFQKGLINPEYLRRELTFDRLTDQYTFHTERALEHLKKVGVKHDE